jgi:hypothetical protein
MREEYQKTIILLSIIFIFGGLYVSSFFDVGSIHHNNTYLFMILVACLMIGYLQTKKIKRWKEEKQTDYLLVYWCYMALTSFLFLYLSYMIVTRSELECMRVLKINMSGTATKIYYRGTNTINNIRNNGVRFAKFKNKVGGAEMGASYTGGYGVDSDNLVKRMTAADTVSYLFQGYKKIWRKILMMKEN